MNGLRYESITRKIRGRETGEPVSVRIQAGEAVGVTGDRGSVSALLLALAGDLVPNRWWGRRAARGVSYLPPQSLIPDLLTGAEWLRYRSAVSGASPTERIRRIREAADLSRLGERLERRLTSFPASDVAVLAVATEVSVASRALIIDCTLNPCSDEVIGRFARAFWAKKDLAIVVAGSDRVIGKVAERTIVLEQGRVVRDEPTSFFLCQRVVEVEVSVRALNDLAQLFEDVPGVERSAAGLTVPLGVDRNAQQVLTMCHERGIPVLSSKVLPARFHHV